LREDDLERLLRCVRVRPGHLDLYLEICGVEHIRRAVYKAGASLRIRYDDRLFGEIENVVGSGNVRLLGSRGATARVETHAQTTLPAQFTAAHGNEEPLEEGAGEEFDED
jgi:DNA polymerase-3 subunit alpha